MPKDIDNMSNYISTNVSNDIDNMSNDISTNISNDIDNMSNDISTNMLELEVVDAGSYEIQNHMQNGGGQAPYSVGAANEHRTSEATTSGELCAADTDTSAIDKVTYLDGEGFLHLGKH